MPGSRPERLQGTCGRRPAGAVIEQLAGEGARLIDLAREAIRALGLKGNPEFDPAASGPSLSARVMSLLGMLRAAGLVMLGGGGAMLGCAATGLASAGSGIGAADLPHIFERFYRAKGGRKAEGLGLGLYITRMLVEAHGGRIWAESRLGQGTTIYFSLIRRTEPAAEEEIHGQAENSAGG